VASKFVKLTKPFDLGGKRLIELEIKEPTGGDYMRLGDPRTLVFNASGSGYWVEQNDVIRVHFEKCVISDLGADVVNQLSIEDVMGLKEGLFDFFTAAAGRRSATRPSATASPPCSRS
jgi:hypothetical protein